MLPDGVRSPWLVKIVGRQACANTLPGKTCTEVFMPTVICQQCAASFKTPEWRLKQGKGKFCSRSCANEAMRGFHATYPAEYMAYHDAKRRCVNPYHSTNQKNYKDRGIKFLFCSFQQFFDCLGPRPDGTSLDRIDNDGHYEPSNVRWATATEQAQNKRTNKCYTFDGLTLCAAEWDRRLGLHRGTVSRRIKQYGWSPEKALTKPAPLHR